MPPKTIAQEHTARRRGSRRPAGSLPLAAPEGEMLAQVFAELPYALLVCDPDGRVVARNGAAERMLGKRGASCCDLLGCRLPGSPLQHGCITDLARRDDAPLPEIRLDLPGPDGAAWVAAAPMSSDCVVIHLRPGLRGDRRRRSEAHWMNGPGLHIRCLGPLRVDSDVGEIAGGWTEQRPGQVLGYLLAERRRTVRPEVLAEALWPEGDQSVMNTVRYFVHALRDRLEPRRERRRPSSFVVFRGGGYAINENAVRIDAEEFEQAVEAGLAAAAQEPAAAARHLRRALALYGGDFLEDQPYAEWAREERDRLHALATRAVRALIALPERGRDAAATTALWARLAALEPLDEEVHRELIRRHLADERQSLAARSYAALRQRLERELGRAPSFELAELADTAVDAGGDVAASRFSRPSAAIAADAG